MQEWGFETNPYDPCVANKTFNGEQCTVLWHVDNLKVSHVDKKVVEAVLELLNSEFGKETPLRVVHGKVHNYLGMRIDYTIPGKVKITMIDYIESMLKELTDDMNGTALTPAPNHLFEVNPCREPLASAKAELYHHNTAKLLFYASVLDLTFSRLWPS